jgi:uncharacterized protein (TIGR02391 family)
MYNAFDKFQSVVRKARKFTEARSEPSGGLHPFDERNIHPKIENVAKSLFDNGHYAQATFEAYKYVDKQVQHLSGLNESGLKLMMQAFNETSPITKLTDLSNTSEKDEQQGYKFIFSGAVLAVRNPRGHECGIRETPDQCLDHLGLASLLMRRLDNAKRV